MRSLWQRLWFVYLWYERKYRSWTPSGRSEKRRVFSSTRSVARSCASYFSRHAKMAFQTGMCDESALLCIVQLVTAPCAADRSIFEPVVLRVTYVEGKFLKAFRVTSLRHHPAAQHPGTGRTLTRHGTRHKHTEIVFFRIVCIVFLWFHIILITVVSFFCVFYP